MQLSELELTQSVTEQLQWLYQVKTNFLQRAYTAKTHKEAQRLLKWDRALDAEIRLLEARL